MFVKPAPGRAPRDPRTNLRVPASGLQVPDHDPHWAILLRDGDVVRADAPPAEPPAESTADAPHDPK